MDSIVNLLINVLLTASLITLSVLAVGVLIGALTFLVRFVQEEIL